MIQPADGLCGRLRLELHHIYPRRQSFERQGVLKELIGLFFRILTCLLAGYTRQQRYDLLIVLFITGVFLKIAISLRTVDRHRERRDIPYLLQRHLLCALWQPHLMLDIDMIAWTRQSHHRVAQDVYPLPVAPTVQGLLEIVDLGGHIGIRVA